VLNDRQADSSREDAARAERATVFTCSTSAPAHLVYKTFFSVCPHVVPTLLWGIRRSRVPQQPVRTIQSQPTGGGRRDAALRMRWTGSCTVRQ
jgi:hypothetical protein